MCEQVKVDPKEDVSDLEGAQTTWPVYTRRWIVLFLFVLVFLLNSFQWIQYTIISEIVKRYYGISDFMVNNTSIVYLVTYLPLVLPASYIIDKKGLRYAVILAALGNCVGSWIKVGSAAPDRFYIGLIGQSVLSIAQLFIMSIPALLAATWFGPAQVSTACAIGVFGTQIGTALGFLLTPIVVQDRGDLDQVGYELLWLFVVQAVITTLVLLGVIFLFKDQPPIAPSRAQANLREGTNKEAAPPVLQSFWNLMKNVPFLMLMASYGLSIGLYNTISTLLSPLILEHFPNESTFAGRVGMIIVLSGTFSTVIFGVVLDRSRRYKETTIVIYLMSAIGMTAFTFALISESHIYVYISSLILGVFMTGYLSVGYEVATELTYPEPEANSSGMLNAVSQTTGVIFTYLFQYLLGAIGHFWSNITICVLLYVGVVVTICTPNDLRRQRANASEASSIRTNNNEEVKWISVGDENRKQ